MTFPAAVVKKGNFFPTTGGCLDLLSTINHIQEQDLVILYYGHVDRIIMLSG
jgi:hypothetical protein